MSKKGGKSTLNKSDKSDKRTTPTNELIHGILDNDWTIFQEIEQRDVIIADVVCEIVEESLNKIIELHTDRLSVKKAVQDATGILSDALRLYFVSSDKETLGFEEEADSPPKSSKTDSWSRGRVKVVKNTRKEIRSQSRVSAGINVAFPPSTTTAESVHSITENKEKIKTEASDILKPSGVAGQINKERIKQNTKIRQNFKRYSGRVKSANVKNMTKALDQAEEMKLKSKVKNGDGGNGIPSTFKSMWKVMNNRPSNRDLLQFDGSGNVENVFRLPAKALPQIHKTRPKINIEESMVIPSKSDQKEKKTKKYKIATLRPLGTSDLANPHTFELAHGVQLLEGEFSSVKSVSDLEGTGRPNDLEPIKIIHQSPFDPSNIVKQTTTY
jgi:hypothetical protein